MRGKGIQSDLTLLTQIVPLTELSRLVPSITGYLRWSDYK